MNTRLIQAENLVTLASEAGYSEQEIADMMGPDGPKQSTINRIKNRTATRPSSETIEAIITNLGMRLLSGAFENRISEKYETPPVDEKEKQHRSMIKERLALAHSAIFSKDEDATSNISERLRLSDGYTFVPRYNILAGLGEGESITSEQVIDALAFRTEWLQSQGIDAENAVCIKCKGDSMSPSLRHGDIALIDLGQKTPTDGIYAIGRRTAADQHEVIIKRIEYKLSGQLIISSDNQAANRAPETYEPGYDLEQLNIIGRVVWSGGAIT